MDMVIKPNMFTIHTPKFRKIYLHLHVEIRNLNKARCQANHARAVNGAAIAVSRTPTRRRHCHRRGACTIMDTVNFWWLFFCELFCNELAKKNTKYILKRSNLPVYIGNLQCSNPKIYSKKKSQCQWKSSELSLNDMQHFCSTGQTWKIPAI